MAPLDKSALRAIQAMLKAEWCTATITLCGKSSRLTVMTDGKLIAKLSCRQIITFLAVAKLLANQLW